MKEQELNEIERLAVDQDRLFDPCVVIALLAEIRRLRCCGNCRKQQYDGMDYFCDEDNCEKHSLWEAAGNG